ncbi:four helix bundle protein [Vitreimonas sp.]|jgi:four helix bundle protein|uniref:four helix bundle protein n=1 Tax=Vitreimonas sp. TaxID=3069702 RepID=UPI002ED95344
MGERRGSGAPSVWDMLVFRKAYDVALEVHRIAQTFPKHEQYELASQLRRSSKSICANLAEGRARQQGSTAEFRRFVLIALGSADESALWCKFAKDLGYLSDEQFERYHGQFAEIARMLNGLVAKLNSP